MRLTPYQTACTLTYITYLMAMYPQVAKKLRTEVLEHCGLTNPATFETVRNMKYSASSSSFGKCVDQRLTII